MARRRKAAESEGLAELARRLVGLSRRLNVRPGLSLTLLPGVWLHVSYGRRGWYAYVGGGWGRLLRRTPRG